MASRASPFVMGNAGLQNQPAQQFTPNRALVHQAPRQQAMDPVFRNDGLDGTYALPQANMGALVQYGNGAENLYHTGPTWVPGQRMVRGYSDEGPHMSRQDSGMSSDSVWTSPSSRANRHYNDFHRRPKREIFDIREDDQCMTEAQARDKLSSYVVIRMERANVEHDVDRDGNKRQPTWEKAEQVMLTDVSEKDAQRKIRELDTFTPFITDKRGDLAAAINRQLDHALDNLEQQEIDSRYCYELAQIDQKEKKVDFTPETLQPYYIELPPSKSKSKGRKDSKKGHKKKKKPKTYLVEPNTPKPRREKQTVSITAYFRRTPKADEHCLKMLREAEDNWNSGERDGMQSSRLRQSNRLFPDGRRHSPSSPERLPRQQSGPLVLQDPRQMDPRVQSMVQAQQPGFAQQHPQQRISASHPYQTQQEPQSQQAMATLPAGQATSRAQNMHALQHQQFQEQQRQVAAAQRMQQPAQRPAVQQTGAKPVANMQSARVGGQVPPAPPISQQRGQPSGLSRESQPQAKQQGARPVQVKQDSKNHQPKKAEPKAGRGEEGRKPVAHKGAAKGRARSVSSHESNSKDSLTDSDSESETSVSSMDSRRGRVRDRRRGQESRHSRSRSRAEHYGRRKQARDDERRGRSSSVSSPGSSRSRPTPKRVHRTSPTRRRDNRPDMSPIRVEPHSQQPRQPNVRYVDPNVRSGHWVTFADADRLSGRTSMDGRVPQAQAGTRFGGRDGPGNGPPVFGRGAVPKDSAVAPNHPFAPRPFGQRQPGAGY